MATSYIRIHDGSSVQDSAYDGPLPARHTVLLPNTCLSELNRLFEQAGDLPFGHTIAKMYSILKKTCTGRALVYKDGNHYPERCKVWNGLLAKDTMNISAKILQIAYDKIIQSNYTVEHVTSDFIVTAAKAIQDFLFKISEKYLPKMVSYFDANSLQHRTPKASDAMEICQKLIDNFEMKNRFQATPEMSNIDSKLWFSLFSVPSVDELIRRSNSDYCSGCRIVNISSTKEFAITDACEHLFCVGCASSIFNCRGHQTSCCPVCANLVSSWTDATHFIKFKSRSDMKVKIWRTASRLRHVLS